MADSYADALRYKAVADYMAGDYAHALEKFDELCSTTTGHQDHTWRAQTLQLLGRYNDAIAAYQTILADNSNNQFALHHLALLKAACPVPEIRNGQEAIALATRACDITHWNNWVDLSVLAAAHAEAGDWAQAERFARITLELAPDDEQDRRRARLTQYEARQPYRTSPESDRSLLIVRDPSFVSHWQTISPTANASLSSQAVDKKIVSLTQWARSATIAFFVSLIILIAGVFLTPANFSLGAIIIGFAAVFNISFGIASLVTIIARELLRWKQDRFRFSVLTLLVLMTELAILFGLLALL